MSLSSELIPILSTNFKKCARGYHMVNEGPIKEAVWEEINTIVLKHSGVSVLASANGSHRPGSDIECSLGNLSNKSVKYDTVKDMDISSYRLTTVCSASEPGTPEVIVGEIMRRKNFQFYSIIARDEMLDERKISYDWFMIPADHPAVNPTTYIWEPMIGKQGKNKGQQVGWKTNIVNGSSMSITFSMSSQLWMSIHITEEMKEFIVASTTCENKRRMDYIELESQIS